MAGTGLTHDNLIQAFERRFDYLSARSVAAQVLDTAGIRKADAYDAGALARIGQAIETVVSRPQTILGFIHAGPVAAAPHAPAAEKKAEHAAEAKPHKAEAVDAKPAEAKPAEAKPAEVPAEVAAAPAGDDAGGDKQGDDKHGDKKKK